MGQAREARPNVSVLGAKPLALKLELIDESL